MLIRSFKRCLVQVCMVGVGALLLAACQKVSPVETGRVPAWFERDGVLAKEDIRAVKAARVPLVALLIEGHEPYKNKRTSLDTGVEETRSKDGETGCRVLSPREQSKVAKENWAPFDFYTNVVSDQEQKDQKDRLGEADIFYVGDDNNRNGTTDSHQWTLIPQKNFSESLEFLEKDRANAWFGFFVNFYRGPEKRPLRFQGLVSVRAHFDKAQGKCVASTFMCTDLEKNKQGNHVCKNGGWNRRLHQIIAQVDKSGAFGDFIRPPKSEREKNDVAHLDAVVTNVDKEGKPKGEAYRMRLATK